MTSMSDVQYEEKYDVIIVGAGPGGLRCAQVLGEAGKKVLLIEKKTIIGPKTCAGGLTRKAIDYLHSIGLPKDIIEQSFDGIVFRKGSWKTRINFGKTFLYTISRKNLGQWQLSTLKKMENVTVYSGKTVTAITSAYVTIDNAQQVAYDYLVGADGSYSIVRKFLKIPTKLFGVAYQYVLPMQSGEYRDIDIIFENKYFHAWYAWIFPYAQSVSIGTGYFPKIMSSKTSMEKFNQWLQDEKIVVNNTPIEAHPINCDYRGYRFDNVFLIGDAAGAASGFTGEGIYQALIFGDEVARSILDRTYKSKAIPKLIREKRIHEAMLAMVILAGPLRNIVFYVVVAAVRISWFGRTLLRVLS